MPVSGLIDIHCHMIPYVDDGAVDLKEAVKMLKMEYDQGVRTIIVTHITEKECLKLLWQK